MDLNKVTRATLKHILYEGARLNRVLRINDTCFEKMIEILNITFDSDDEEEDPNNDKSHHTIVSKFSMPRSNKSENKSNENNSKGKTKYQIF